MSFGINSGLRYYEFELDGLDASAGTDAVAAATDWPNFKIGGKTPLVDVAALKVLEVQIPFTWYVFNAGNVGCGALGFTTSQTPSGTQLTQSYMQLYESGGMGGYVYVPFQYYGNFTTTQMLVQLSNALTQASKNMNTLTYDVGFDSTTQKFWIDNNSTTISFKLVFGTSSNSGNYNPRLWLGFNGGVISSAFTGPYAGASGGGGESSSTALIVAPNAASVTGPNYVYLNSMKLGQLTNLYLPRGAVNLGGGNAGPQIAKIPVNVQPGGIIFWQDPGEVFLIIDPFKYFDLENLSSITDVDFFLTLGNTTTQQPLVLNGQPFSLKLALLQNQYDRNDVSGGLAHNERVTKRVRSI
jgi:hypothetical protein